jgi:hypothetical protein
VVADLMIDTVSTYAPHRILSDFRRGRLRRVG